MTCSWATTVTLLGMSYVFGDDRDDGIHVTRN